MGSPEVFNPERVTVGQKGTHLSSLCSAEFLIVLSLILATLIVYWPVQNHQFLDLDDDVYVTDNREVKSGLTLTGMAWAFTATKASNWHPLTWISHQLDYAIYGLNPGGHHWTNLLFHLANTFLLFLLLKRMTGMLWSSGFIAALFALHPLHVESVAWVAERKDVLSAFFWFLTIWAYIRYVENRSVARFLWVILSFTMGLLSKPMIVTLPFVLLLLDYWPLRRVQSETHGDEALSAHKPLRWPSLVLEKTPFFVLSAISSYLALVAHEKGGAVRSLELFPLAGRIGNASISYVSYMWKMLWPHKLAFYPYEDPLSLWQALAAGVLLVLISAMVIHARRRHPYFTVGWFWYLGTLVPVIGFVQVGWQAMADRYTYIPLIGLFVMVAMGVQDLLGRLPSRRTLFFASGGLILLAFMVVSRFQLDYWHDGITVYEHTLQVTPRSYVIHSMLGFAFLKREKMPEAIEHHVEAVRLRPDFATAHHNLGVALIKAGRKSEAIDHLVEAVRIEPNNGDTRLTLVVAYLMIGKQALAAEQYNILKMVNLNLSKAVSQYFK